MSANPEVNTSGNLGFEAGSRSEGFENRSELERFMRIAEDLATKRSAEGGVSGGVQVITFGCRLNSLESEIIRRHAREAGLEDLVVVHTCAVTAEAERQARQAIRRARRARPSSRIVVTGCAAQIAPDAYAGIAEVDDLLGNREKLRAASWQALARGEKGLVGDVMQPDAVSPDAPRTLVDGIEGRTRAFVQVQEGCDHRCTFCIIPHGRGNNRSVPVGEVLRQAERLVANGHRELVLTGVDIASWGRELADDVHLGDLVEALLEALPQLPRLRLTSLDPAAIDEKLADLLVSHPRLLPHVHLSLQAGDDMILKRMRRRHSRRDVIELCDRLRAGRPDMVFGADMIAGFPTETGEMHQRSLDIVEDAGLTFLHVFPYSPRSGTPAARMPQLPKPVRKERAATLRAVGEAALERFMAKEVGQRRAVLVEHGDRGHTEHFALVRLDTPASPGTLLEVEVKAVEGTTLLGSRVA